MTRYHTAQLPQSFAQLPHRGLQPSLLSFPGLLFDPCLSLPVSSLISAFTSQPICSYVRLCPSSPPTDGKTRGVRQCCMSLSDLNHEKGTFTTPALLLCVIGANMRDHDEQLILCWVHLLLFSTVTVISPPTSKLALRLILSQCSATSRTLQHILLGQVIPIMLSKQAMARPQWLGRGVFSDMPGWPN